MIKNFVVLILAIGIMAMKIKKKDLALLILAVAIIVSVSVISLISFGQEVRKETVLGITIGRSLGAAGLRECRRSEGAYSFKSYDNKDTNCYQCIDCERDACFTQFVPELSFDMTVDVALLDNCDRQSPVQEIRAIFSSSNYDKVLPVMIEKFGKPKKTEKSVVQNSIGVQFQKVESFWNKRGLSVYLTNMHNEIDLGLLEIIRQDRKQGVVKHSQKQIEFDRKKI
jgi:hypothetical protein